MLIVHLIIIALFLVLALVFRRGKGAALIAGYNTMTPLERSRYDEKKLCRVMSRMMFALAGCWAVAASSKIFEAMWLLWLGMGLMLVTCVVGIIYMNGDRMKKRPLAPKNKEDN